MLTETGRYLNSIITETGQRVFVRLTETGVRAHATTAHFVTAEAAHEFTRTTTTKTFTRTEV